MVITRPPAEHARAVPRDHAICVASDGGYSAMTSTRTPEAGTQARKKRRRRRPWRRRPRAADSAKRVRVASRDSRQFRGPLAETFDQQVVRGRHRAVPHFERRHERTRCKYVSRGTWPR